MLDLDLNLDLADHTVELEADPPFCYYARARSLFLHRSASVVFAFRPPIGTVVDFVLHVAAAPLNKVCKLLRSEL